MKKQLVVFLVCLLATPILADWQDVSPSATQILNALYVVTSEAIVAVGDSGRVAATADGGQTWTLGAPVSDHLYGVTFSGDSFYYVGASSMVFQAQNLQDVSPTDTADTNLRSIIFTDSDNGSVIGDYPATGSPKVNVFTTDDGCATWTTGEVANRDLLDASLVAANNAWIAGASATDGYIYSVNPGNPASLSQKHNEAGKKIYGIDMFSATVGYAVGEGGFILKTTDGDRWSTQISGGPQYLNRVSFTSSNIGWVVGAGSKILRTLNGGSTWTDVTPSGADTNVVLEDVSFDLFQSGNRVTVEGWAVGGKAGEAKVYHYANQVAVSSIEVFEGKIVSRSSSWEGDVVVVGSGFDTGASVALKKSGETDIAATSVTITSSTQITCHFNLTSAATGEWELVVVNPDSSSGFTPLTISLPGPRFDAVRFGSDAVAEGGSITIGTEPTITFTLSDDIGLSSGTLNLKLVSDEVVIASLTPSDYTFTPDVLENGVTIEATIAYTVAAGLFSQGSQFNLGLQVENNLGIAKTFTAAATIPSANVTTRIVYSDDLLYAYAPPSSDMNVRDRTKSSFALSMGQTAAGQAQAVRAFGKDVRAMSVLYPQGIGVLIYDLQGRVLYNRSFATSFAETIKVTLPFLTDLGFELPVGVYKVIIKDNATGAIVAKRAKFYVANY